MSIRFRKSLDVIIEQPTYTDNEIATLLKLIREDTLLETTRVEFPPWYRSGLIIQLLQLNGTGDIENLILELLQIQHPLSILEFIACVEKLNTNVQDVIECYYDIEEHCEIISKVIIKNLTEIRSVKYILVDDLFELLSTWKTISIAQIDVIINNWINAVTSHIACEFREMIFKADVIFEPKLNKHWGYILGTIDSNCRKYGIRINSKEDHIRRETYDTAKLLTDEEYLKYTVQWLAELGELEKFKKRIL